VPVKQKVVGWVERQCIFSCNKLFGAKPNRTC